MFNRVSNLPEAPMKLITDHADIAAEFLGKAIMRDPLSWEAWKLLHIEISAVHYTADTPYPHKALHAIIRERCKESNGITLFCSDGDILVLAKGMKETSLLFIGKELTEALLSATQGRAHASLIDVAKEPRVISDICRKKNIAGPIDENTQFVFAPGHSEASLKNEIGRLSTLLHSVIETNLSLRRHINPPCVLLVEDDPVTRRVAALVLKDEYRLITAASAEEAVSSYLLYSPDIVFLDIGLPDSSGFSVLKSILSADKDAYVVMFSSSGYAENMVDALNSGAHGFVTKPFRREQLWHYIRDCHTRYHMHS